jgi:CheY-like chemotaxis protein
VCLEAGLPEALPAVSLDRNLLRQMLLGMLSYLVERAEAATVRLDAAVEGAALRLALRVVPEAAAGPSSPEAAQERILTLRDLASVSGARVEPLATQTAIVGFDVWLPTGRPRTVLIVDDNEDVLALFQRYLGMHQYHAISVRSSGEALALARQVQPHAITLDLMMPGQDGWDTLQTLLNQPETRHIPVIVCSVLKEKELALSLGAVAFLAKPVTEQALLAVLQALG